MNFEDKLSRAERIRLESLSQALQLTMMTRNDGKGEQPKVAEVLEIAERVETWLRAANQLEN